MVYPDWKIKLAELCISKGDRSNYKDVNNLISVFTGTCEKEEAIAVVKSCYDIYKNQPFVKEILESCLLCEDYEESACFDITGIPIDIIDVYKNYFFDTSIFKYRLQKYEYVRTYRNIEFMDATLYKTWALSSGIDFFRWKFNSKDFTVAPKKVLSNLIADTFFRAKEHVGEPLTSNATKESLKWIKQAVDSINSLKSVDTNRDANIADQFRIALTYKEIDKKSDITDVEILN